MTKLTCLIAFGIFGIPTAWGSAIYDLPLQLEEHVRADAAPVNETFARVTDFDFWGGRLYVSDVLQRNAADDNDLALIVDPEADEKWLVASVWRVIGPNFYVESLVPAAQEAELPEDSSHKR